MSEDKPINLIVDAVIREVKSYCSELILDPNCGRGATPIEKILFAAVTVRSKFSNFELTQSNIADGLLLTDGSDIPGLFYVSTQVPLLEERWRVDFVYSVKDPRSEVISHLVVECDGHDFHERTKEQAARDRDRDRRLQARGFTIFRFTGSEIFNDPVRCADAVLEWISQIYWDYVYDTQRKRGED